MRLGVSYNIFEGTELLKYSIKQIRPYADFIILTYQRFSWYGDPILNKDLNEIKRLYKEKIVDMIFCFPITNFVKTSDEARSIEARKRNVSRLLCYEHNCTHFLDLDVDEFYKSEEFILAKNKIIKEEIDYTAINYINYYKNPTYQVESKSNQKVPFICKIDLFRSLGESPGDFIIEGRSMGVDITRGYKTVDIPNKTYLFKPEEIMMHHMLSVRKNLQHKFKVHSGGQPIKKTKQEIAKEMLQINPNNLEYDATSLYRGKEEIRIVENCFDIPIWKGK